MKTTINELTKIDFKKKKIKAYGAKYRATNPEKIKARRIEYYEANSEEIKAKAAKYRAANPEELKAYGYQLKTGH